MMRLDKSLGELAKLVNGELQGDPAFLAEGLAGLAEAGPKDVSFLGNVKYAQAAAVSKAGCLFLPAANKGFSCASPNRIYVEDPQYAFSLALRLLADKRSRPAAGVDPRAAVHPEARLGQGVSVGPFAVVERGAAVGDGSVVSALCFVGENARLGKGCLLHPRAVVREDCVLGDRVIVQPGAVIGGDGYGFSTDRETGKHRKIPQLGNVVVEDDVEIGANAAVDRATIGSTVIGAGTKIDNLVQIAHNVRTGKDCLIVSQVGVSGSTTLGDRVILAGQAGIIGHLHLGDGAIVMAQSGVMEDLKPGEIVFGSPSHPRREAMKIQAILAKLPEMYEFIRGLRKRTATEV